MHTIHTHLKSLNPYAPSLVTSTNTNIRARFWLKEQGLGLRASWEGDFGTRAPHKEGITLVYSRCHVPTTSSPPILGVVSYHLLSLLLWFVSCISHAYTRHTFFIFFSHNALVYCVKKHLDTLSYGLTILFLHVQLTYVFRPSNYTTHPQSSRLNMHNLHDLLTRKLDQNQMLVERVLKTNHTHFGPCRANEPKTKPT